MKMAVFKLQIGFTFESRYSELFLFIPADQYGFLSKFWLLLRCNPHSKETDFYLAFATRFYSLQKIVKTSCLTGWMTLSSSISVWIVSATCSYSVSLGGYVQQKNNFWMSCWKLLKSTNTSMELNECQVLLGRLCRKHFRRQRQICSNWKKTNVKKAGAMELLKVIAVIKKSQHPADLLGSIDIFSGDLVTLKVLLCHLEI